MMADIEYSPLAMTASMASPLIIRLPSVKMTSTRTTKSKVTSWSSTMLTVSDDDDLLQSIQSNNSNNYAPMNAKPSSQSQSQLDAAISIDLKPTDSHTAPAAIDIVSDYLERCEEIEQETGR